MEEGPQWEFAPFRLDPKGWMLWHKNQPVALPPRAFSVLCYLVEHAGRLVTKDQLLDAVWQHRFVSESVLKVCINELRRTLDDSAKTPRYIETVSRRGYRFIGAPKRLENVEATPQERRHTVRSATTADEVAATRLDGSRREAVETGDSAVFSTDRLGPTAWVSAAAELRQVTVLVATLIEEGVTPLELEPEAEHDRINQYFRLTLAVVQRYVGVIVQRLKNTLVAVLGLPGARSDDAERALRAARDLHRDLGAVATQPLRARIGLASGLVVASATRDPEHAYAITGTALDIAMDLAAKAAPGETLLDESLHQSNAGRSAGAVLMETTILDFKQRPVWRVGVGTGADSRATQLRFVGRQPELRVFQGIVEISAESGSGHSVLVRGEAGIGKTRLVEEFTICA